MKKILLFLIIGLFFVSPVLAYTKTYDPNTETILIERNNGDDLLEFQLLYNTYTCGLECTAILKITVFENNLGSPLQKVNFKKRISRLWRNAEIKSLELQSYNNNTNRWITRTREQINTGFNTAGIYYVRLKGEKYNVEDDIDWILNIFGIDLSEWAVWEGGLIYDEIDDSYINQSLWTNSTSGGIGTATVTETNDYLQTYTSTSCGGSCGDNKIAQATTTNMINLSYGEYITTRISLARGGSLPTIATVYASIGGEIFKQNTNDDSVWKFLKYNDTLLQIFDDGINTQNISNPTDYNIKIYSSSPNPAGTNNATARIYYIYYQTLNNPLILEFSENNNVTITPAIEEHDNSKDDIIQFVDSLDNYENGKVIVSFGNDQIYSFYNDNLTSLFKYLKVITPDLDQNFKVISSGLGVSNAVVTVKQQIDGETNIIGGGVTDVNGEVTIPVDDGNTYIIEVTKEGYNNFSRVEYIALNQDKTIILSLDSTTDSTLLKKFYLRGCNPIISKNDTCNFKVTTEEEINTIIIYSNYSNGTIINTTCNNATSCTSKNFFLYDNSTTPIYSWYSLNGIIGNITLQIDWEDITARRIQINFPADEIRANSNYLILFYVITLLFGLFISLSIEKKISGSGIITFIIWCGIIASTGFYEYWLVIFPVIILEIFKLWGEWFKQ